MRSERIGDSSDGISGRWLLAPGLVCMLLALDQRADAIFSAKELCWPGLYIISGYRPPSLQGRLNPAVKASLHSRRPALAADLRIGDVPATLTPIEFWGWLGGIWKTLGGRWGGDFSVGAPAWITAGFSTGDFNHFDTGGSPLDLP